MSEKIVGHVYQITYDLGNGRQFSVNGNFAEGMSEDDMFHEAEKCLKVADRVRARGEIELLGSELSTRRKYLERAKEDLEQMLNKERKTPGDENQIISLRASIKKITQDVAEGEQNLAEAKAKANGSHVMAGNQSVN